MTFLVEPGTIILHENEINMDMYKIVKGHVELYKGYEKPEETLLGLLSVDAYFGEMGVFTQKPSIYTVVAYDTVALERIPISDIETFIKNNPQDVVKIMRNMANTMYNLKYDIDLLSKERVIDPDAIAKKLLKYNLGLYTKARRAEGGDI